MRLGLLVVLAVAGTGLIWQAMRGDPPALDPMETAALSPAPAPALTHEFTIANLASSGACLASRGEAVTRRSREFAVDSGCETVWPGLASVRTWTDNEDGTVSLTDQRGEVVLTLGEADGVAFEAIEPQGALITLTRAD